MNPGPLLRQQSNHYFVHVCVCRGRGGGVILVFETAHKTHVLLLFHLRGFYLIGLGLGNSHLVIFSQCLYIHFVLVHSFESFTVFFLATSCSFL